MFGINKVIVVSNGEEGVAQATNVPSNNNVLQSLLRVCSVHNNSQTLLAARHALHDVTGCCPAKDRPSAPTVLPWWKCATTADFANDVTYYILY